MAEQKWGYDITETADGWEARCSKGNGDVYATKDKKSLMHYLENYELCDCGAHTPIGAAEVTSHWYTR